MPDKIRVLIKSGNLESNQRQCAHFGKLILTAILWKELRAFFVILCSFLSHSTVHLIFVRTIRVDSAPQEANAP